MLALGILGFVIPASPSELRPLGQDEEASITLRTLTKRGWTWPEKMSPLYGGLQALLEDVAQGIEERQAELERWPEALKTGRMSSKKQPEVWRKNRPC